MDILLDLNYNNHIILDQPSSWPSKITKSIDNSKISLQQYFKEQRRIDKLVKEIDKYRFHRPINKYKDIWDNTIDDINIELKNKKIVGFHCSRLMDYEINEIQKFGLRPLDLDFAHSRIERLYKNGLIRDEFKEQLKNKKELSDPSRVNSLFFFHCKSTLMQEFGIFRLFRSWGGESIYVNFERAKVLQKIGIPCIILGSIDMIELQKRESNLAARMICNYLDDNYYPHDFDLWVHCPVKVLDIFKYSDKIFKDLTNIDNWDQKVFDY